MKKSFLLLFSQFETENKTDNWHCAADLQVTNKELQSCHSVEIKQLHEQIFDRNHCAEDFLFNKIWKSVQNSLFFFKNVDNYLGTGNLWEVLLGLSQSHMNNILTKSMMHTSVSQVSFKNVLYF